MRLSNSFFSGFRRNLLFSLLLVCVLAMASATPVSGTANDYSSTNKYNFYFTALLTADHATPTDTGFLTVDPSSTTAGKTDQDVVYAYTIGQDLHNGTVTFTSELIDFSVFDTVTIGQQEPRDLSAGEISDNGRRVTIEGLNLDGGDTVEIIQAAKTMPSAGTYEITARADADGDGTEYSWSSGISESVYVHVAGTGGGGPGQVIFVDKNAPGPEQDGLSWGTAFTTISTALDIAEDGDEIWVAAGEYAEKITLVNGVALYGGFSGTETARDERDFRENETIINGSGWPWGTVVTSPPGADLTTRLDGFTITGGYAVRGGGILCENSSPTIANNKIINNQTSGDSEGSEYGPGGGIFLFNSSAVIINNVFMRNNGNVGAAIYCGPFYNGIIANNVLSYNFPSNSGTIAVIGTPKIYNNTIVDNNSWFGGGDAIYINTTETGAEIVNNIIGRNMGAGIINASGSVGALVNYNCVFLNEYEKDYVGLNPGSEDLQVDAKFVGFEDYHLSPESPCIDRGDTGVLGVFQSLGLVSLDMDGEERPLGAKIDIGADEFTPIPGAPQFENSTPLVMTEGLSNRIDIEVDLDKAGTVYYVVVNYSDAAPSVDQVKEGKAANDDNPVSAGTITITDPDISGFASVTGLTGNAAYDLYFVAESGEFIQNTVTLVPYVWVNTSDTTPPTADPVSPFAWVVNAVPGDSKMASGDSFRLKFSEPVQVSGATYQLQFAVNEVFGLDNEYNSKLEVVASGTDDTFLVTNVSSDEIDLTGGKNIKILTGMIFDANGNSNEQDIIFEVTDTTASGQCFVEISPDKDFVSPGEEFTVEVWVNGIQNLYGMSFDMLFDPDIMSVVSPSSFSPVTQGEFFREEGFGEQKNEYDNETGTVYFAQTLSGDVPGVNINQATLAASVTFRVHEDVDYGVIVLRPAPYTERLIDLGRGTGDNNILVHLSDPEGNSISYPEAMEYQVGIVSIPPAFITGPLRIEGKVAKEDTYTKVKLDDNTFSAAFNSTTGNLEVETDLTLSNGQYEVIFFRPGYLSELRTINVENGMGDFSSEPVVLRFGDVAREIDGEFVLVGEDETGDGVIDLGDLTLLAQKYGASELDSDWDTFGFVLDGRADGIIDLYDLVLLCRHFEETSVIMD